MNEKENLEEYKLIIEMLKEAESQYKEMKKSMESTVEYTYGLKSEVLETILPYEIDSIPEMDINEMREFLNTYLINTSTNKYNDMEEEELRKEFKCVKEISLLLLKSKEETKKLKEESNEILNEYMNYMSSDKIKEARLKRLERLREALELETNEVEKNKIKKMIDTMESSMDFSFLKTRFDKFGDKEIENIKNGFFDDIKGGYIMDRFRKKIKAYGFSEDIYKYFFNIEENFLPKKYSKFNNLFLFIYLRMVAYSDNYNKYDKIFVNSVTSAVSNLVYHKFDSTDTEEYFIKVLCEIIDKFEKYADYFEENNPSYENHPVRKETEANHELKRKESIMKKLDSLKITDYDDSLSADELQAYYNEQVDIMTNKQIKKEEPQEVEEEPVEETTEEVVESETDEAE